MSASVETIASMKNNCVLVMMKDLTGKPDAEILATVRQHNYKDHHGMWDRDWMPALAKLGILVEQERPGYRFKQDARSAGQPMREFTLNRAMRHMREGVWIARTNSHVLVVRDGKLVDPNFRFRAALRRNCISIQRVLNAHAPVKRGVLRLARRSTRRPGTATYKRFFEASFYLSTHNNVTRQELLANTTYDAIDLAWDLKRGNIIED